MNDKNIKFIKFFYTPLDDHSAFSVATLGSFSLSSTADVDSSLPSMALPLIVAPPFPVKVSYNTLEYAGHAVTSLPERVKSYTERAAE